MTSSRFTARSTPLLLLATLALASASSARVAPGVYASSFGDGGAGHVYRYLSGTSWERVSPAGGLGWTITDMELVDGDLWVTSELDTRAGVWRYDGSAWTNVCNAASDTACVAASSVRLVDRDVYITSGSGIWRWAGGTSWTHVAGAEHMTRSFAASAQEGHPVLFVGDGYQDYFWIHDPQPRALCPQDCPEVSGDACSAGCWRGSCVYSFTEHDEHRGLGPVTFAGAYEGVVYSWNSALGEFVNHAIVGLGHVYALASWDGEFWAGTSLGNVYSSRGGVVTDSHLVTSFAESTSAMAADEGHDLLWIGFGKFPFAADGHGDSIIRTFDGAAWTDRALPGSFGRGVTRIVIAPEPLPVIACDAGPPATIECARAGAVATLDASATLITGANPDDAAYSWTGDFDGGSASGQTVDVTFHDPGVHDVTLVVSVGSITESCETTVSVVDSLPPVLHDVPVDARVACNLVPPLDPRRAWADDECDGRLEVTATEVRLDGPCPDSYQLVRTWTASDSAGHSTSATQVLDVEDRVAPALAGVPSDARAPCNAVPPPARPTATDDCDPAPDVAMDERRVDGPCEDSYVLVRTWTATDRCGNAISAAQSLTIVDEVPPVLAGVPPDARSSCNAVPPPARPAASDDCDPSPHVAMEERRVDGPCEDSYVLVRTWTATDRCGNAASATQSLTIVDEVPPVLAGVPPDATADCRSVPEPASPTASDNCDPAPQVRFAERRIDGLCAGTYDLERTWSATDRCGNSAVGRQVVHVRDTTPPVTTPGTTDLYCLWPPNHRLVSFTTADFHPEIHDDCSDPVTWRLAGCGSTQPRNGHGDGNTDDDCMVAPDGSSFQVRAERDGRDPAGRRYSITVVATDACGNESAPVVIGFVWVPRDQDSASRCSP